MEFSDIIFILLVVIYFIATIIKKAAAAAKEGEQDKTAEQRPKTRIDNIFEKIKDELEQARVEEIPVDDSKKAELDITIRKEDLEDAQEEEDIWDEEEAEEEPEPVVVKSVKTPEPEPTPPPQPITIQSAPDATDSFSLSDVSIEKLRGAIIWAEILAPPLSERDE